MCMKSQFYFIYAKRNKKKILKTQIVVGCHVKLYKVKPQKFRYANKFDIGFCSINVHRTTT